MEPINNPLNNLDELITAALKEKPGKELSHSFTDDLLIKIEKRLRWHELLQEFALKTGIVAGALMILLVFLFFPAREISKPFLMLLSENWQIVTGGFILLLFTGFIDQVLLKFYQYES